MYAYLMATAVALAPAPAEEVAPPTHEVRLGESLSSIAQCELGDGDRWIELVTLNDGRIDDPDLIEAGWVLVLPEPGTGNCPERRSQPASAAAEASEPTRQKARKVKAKAAPAATKSGTQSGGAQTGGRLARIRSCESSGNYGAVSANGKYRGAYQFDRQTWASVGGSGDPAAASPQEQDQRAAALYRQRGGTPWPSCS